MKNKTCLEHNLTISYDPKNGKKTANIDIKPIDCELLEIKLEAKEQQKKKLAENKKIIKDIIWVYSGEYYTPEKTIVLPNQFKTELEAKEQKKTIMEIIEDIQKPSPYNKTGHTLTSSPEKYQFKTIKPANTKPTPKKYELKTIQSNYTTNTPINIDYSIIPSFFIGITLVGIATHMTLKKLYNK